MMETNIDFLSLLQQSNGDQKRLDIESAISIYFGYSQEGYIRLSFLSSLKPFKVESTANLQVSYNDDPTGAFWSHFDLIDKNQEVVFISFVKNLIESASYCITEEQALRAVKQRFITWKSLFKKNVTASIPSMVVQGVYGELLFLYTYMIPRYGVEKSIMAWAGPEGKRKDFAIDDCWYEIKTIGANTSKVHISSMSQLSSDKPGRLVVIKVEAFADQYDGDYSCVADLFNKIKDEIKDEAIENVFYSRFSLTGIVQSDEAMNLKFKSKEQFHYIVDEAFPKITESTKPYPEICDAEYDLSLNALDEYLER